MEFSGESASIEMLLNSLKETSTPFWRHETPRSKGHRMYEKGLLQNLLLQGSPRVRLVEHLAGRSDVWNRFSIVVIDGQTSEFAACKRCGHVLTFRARDGTSGLRKHVCPQRTPLAKNSKVPDHPDRMGMEGSSTTTKLEGASNYLTCSPLLSTMPGIQEDLLSAGAGPSSQDPMEENAPHTDFDPEEIDVKAEPVFNVAPEICEDENSENNTQSSCDRPSSQSSPTSGMTGPYLLKKETHCATILDQLLRDDTFSDVTLTAEGQSIRAHKIVLCLASAYFRQVLSKESSVQNVIVFRDIKFSELRNLINFIYTGEATVDAAELESFMRTAEMLEVNSLCEGQRNFPRNLFPKVRETEPEKLRTPITASKRSHNAMPSSPPTKSRKIMEASSPPTKLPKLSPCPSTSTEGAVSSVPATPPVIKSEPPGDEMTVEEEFRGRDDNDDPYDNPVKSPSHDEDPDKSPPDSRDESPAEKVPPGRCPFCSSSPRIGPSLTKHVHLCHPDKAAFPCDNCSRVFLKKGSFEAHIDDCIR